jgi:hypothetical protein
MLQRKNRLHVPKLACWRYKLEPSKALKVGFVCRIVWSKALIQINCLKYDEAYDSWNLWQSETASN